MSLARALEMALRPSDQPPPTAVCPSCDEPLIMTMAWRKAEFYCINCGAHSGWLDPKPVVANPELQARYDAIKAEWDVLSVGLIAQSAHYLDTCEQCRAEPHEQHATDDEQGAHAAALDRLQARIRWYRTGAIMDFPTSWAFVRISKLEDHHENCSWRTQAGALLCDCDVLNKEYERRKAARS